MSQEPEPNRPSGVDAGRNWTTMVSWLGFFLLVFAVAGVAFYLAGDPQVVGTQSPAAISRK